MNKAAFISTLSLLPVFAYAPLTHAAPDESSQPVVEATQVIQLEKPLQLGDQMISFKVENSLGGMHDLDTLLEDGPVVLTFFRGSWCPYCIGELSSIQKRLEKITLAGGTVLAISPEAQENTEELAEQKKYGFLIGTDHDNTLAKQLALAFTLDTKTIKTYLQYGIDVPESNGVEEWELPIPATYVIDTDRTIRFAYVDENYSKRADYDKVIGVLETIQAEESDQDDG